MAGSKPAALPLGDTPASASPALVAGAHLTAAGASPPARKLRVHGRAVEPARHVAPPEIGNLRREALGFDRARALGEYARARARQPRARPPPPPPPPPRPPPLGGGRPPPPGSQSLRPPD